MCLSQQDSLLFLNSCYSIAESVVSIWCRKSFLVRGCLNRPHADLYRWPHFSIGYRNLPRLGCTNPGLLSQWSDRLNSWLVLQTETRRAYHLRCRLCLSQRSSLLAQSVRRHFDVPDFGTATEDFLGCWESCIGSAQLWWNTIIRTEKSSLVSVNNATNLNALDQVECNASCFQSTGVIINPVISQSKLGSPPYLPGAQTLGRASQDLVIIYLENAPKKVWYPLSWW